MSSDKSGKSIGEYPSWKAALFDSDKVVNLRCFVKYCTWHTSYALLAAAVIAWTGITKVANAFPSERVSASASTASRAVSNPKAKKASRYAVNGFFGAVLIGAIAFMGWIAVTQTALFAVSIGACAAFFGFLFALSAGNRWLKKKGVHGFLGKKLRKMGRFILRLFVNDTTKETATVVVKKGKKAKQKAPETKGVRRVYGQCPVNMNITPKWFDQYVDD